MAPAIEQRISASGVGIVHTNITGMYLSDVVYSR